MDKLAQELLDYANGGYLLREDAVRASAVIDAARDILTNGPDNGAMLTLSRAFGDPE